jgi:hypothetical protein
MERGGRLRTCFGDEVTSLLVGWWWREVAVTSPVELCGLRDQEEALALSPSAQGAYPSSLHISRHGTDPAYLHTSVIRVQNRPDGTLLPTWMVGISRETEQGPPSPASSLK